MTQTTVSSSSGLIAVIAVVGVPISSRLLAVSQKVMMMLMSHPIDVVVGVVAVVLQSPSHPLFDCRLELL